MKLPKGVLANAGKAIMGAGKAAINPQTYRNAYNAVKNTAGTVKQTAAKASNAVKNVAPAAVKVAVPAGAATAGTVAMNQAHKLGA